MPMLGSPEIDDKELHHQRGSPEEGGVSVPEPYHHGRPEGPEGPQGDSDEHPAEYRGEDQHDAHENTAVEGGDKAP